MTPRLLRKALLALAALVPLASVSAAGLPQNLDYSGTVRESTMVFVPHQDYPKYGAVFFSEYAEQVTPSAKSVDLMRLFVNLIPTAHRDGLYTTFTNQYGIIDDRLVPVPAFGACQVSSAVKGLAVLSALPLQYQPRILAGNWPFACTLSVWFLPEDEAAVRDAIAVGHGITMSASVPLCAPDSPRYDSPAIAQALTSQNVLRPGANGFDLVGNLWDVLFATVVLTRDQPALFGTVDPREGWRALMGALVIDTAKETATVPYVRTRYPGFVCQPTPLEIRY